MIPQERIDIWAALMLIRDALEELGPVGALRAGEQVSTTPHFGHILDEAHELVRGIQRLAEVR